MRNRLINLKVTEEFYYLIKFKADELEMSIEAFAKQYLEF